MEFTKEEKTTICDALFLFERDLINLAYSLKDDDLLRILLMDRACEINHLSKKVNGLEKE